MIAFIIISLIGLAAYIGYAVAVIKSAPWSVSDTYYQLNKRSRPGWLFQIAMIAPAALLLPAWLEVSPESWQFLAFLACGGLIFVGSAPAFKLELEGKVHYCATAICGVSAITWVCAVGLWYIPAVLIAAALFVSWRNRFRKCMFWMELACFASAYAAVIIKSL